MTQRKNEMNMISNRNSRMSRLGRFTLSLIKYFGAFAFLLSSGLGIFLYVALRGPDVALAEWHLWGMTKWYLVDAHVVFAFAFLTAGVIYWAVHWISQARRWPRSSPRERWAFVLALLILLFSLRHVLYEHPILIESVRITQFEATPAADQIMLTWSGDPRTTQTIQWRTSPEVQEGFVRYRPAGLNRQEGWSETAAATILIKDEYLANDDLNARHALLLENLDPDTTYSYKVGCGNLWSEEAVFSTAPAQEQPFKFVYLGDAQTGLAGWGQLLHNVYDRHPDAAFYVIAGDLVNQGCDRGDWDAFFAAGEGVFNRRPLVPAIGNHDDCNEEGPRIYLDLFTLPPNGPDSLPRGHSYSFQYANAFFVVLDSNLDPETQTAWLDEQLAQATAHWKLAVFHHPVYSPKSSRDNPRLRREWRPLFDRYGVDLVLLGHDHSYMRTFPMFDDQPVESTRQGTVYVVSLSGDKYYEQETGDYAAVAYENLSTYQIIDVEDNRMIYRAYDPEGKIVDELTFEKP